GAVREMAGDKPVIRYKNTIDTLDKIIEENTGIPGEGDASKILRQAKTIRKHLVDLAASRTAATTPKTNPMAGAAGKAFIPPVPAAGDVPVHSIGSAMKTRSQWGKGAKRTGNVFADI